MFYVHTNRLKKPTFCVVYVNMIKFDTKISLFMTLFFAQAIKNIRFSQTLHEHVECGDTHVYIFPNFFDIYFSSE
jgi:hypothetical protein